MTLPGWTYSQVELISELHVVNKVYGLTKNDTGVNCHTLTGATKLTGMWAMLITQSLYTVLIRQHKF